MKTIEKTTNKESTSGTNKILHRWLYDTEFDHFETLCKTQIKKRVPIVYKKGNSCQVCEDLVKSGHWVTMIKDLGKYLKFFMG